MAHPNFKVILESTSLESDLVLFLRDVRVRVIPAGENRQKQDKCIQVRGLVRATGKLEARSALALAADGMEISLAQRLETNPVGEEFVPESQRTEASKRRRTNVLMGGKTGKQSFRKGRQNRRALGSLLSQKAPEKPPRKGD
jgi:hypothetical protein